MSLRLRGACVGLGLIGPVAMVEAGGEILLGCYDPPSQVLVFEDLTNGIAETGQASLWLQYDDDNATRLGDGYLYTTGMSGASVILRTFTDAQFDAFVDELTNGADTTIQVVVTPHEFQPSPTTVDSLESLAFQLGEAPDFGFDSITRIRLVFETLLVDHLSATETRITQDIRVEVFGERSCPGDVTRDFVRQGVGI